MMTVRDPTLICLIFSLLLSISKHNNLHLCSYNFIILAKPSLVTLFFIFHFIIITIFVGSFKPSLENFEHSFSSLTPPVYEMDKTIQRVEVCGSTSTDDEDVDQSYTSYGYDDSYRGSNEHDEDNDDDANDAEDEDSEDEEYDNELEKKIEEFIAKVYQKRREEFLGDRLLCITAGQQV